MAALFLRKVAKENSIPFEELRDSVLCEFTYEQLEDLDPDREYFADTEHFDRFVRQHDFEKVNIGTVVLYLKGVKLAVSNSDLSCDLEDASSYLAVADLEIRFIKEVLFITGFVLTSFSFLL